METLEGRWYIVINTYKFAIFEIWRFFYITTSGNHTPGSRFYSDLLDTSADFVCIHQLVLKHRSKCQAARIIAAAGLLSLLSQQ